MENLALRGHHWPSGIPACIKHHSQGDLTLDELKEEVKGWFLFVKIPIPLTMGSMNSINDELSSSSGPPLHKNFAMYLSLPDCHMKR
ncbi:hypothetical protein BJY04DRAFT_89371 [Aspergillus karnatakaensis]|uniref:uncharacterized protein n=1 Tax=Aspergillus karnatakaensis TaxID=1810916 RepID=UPI003CCDB58A